MTIKLFAGFRRGRFVVKDYEYIGRVSISQVVQALAIPFTEVGVLLCNGRHADFDCELVDGDICSIFPKVGGG